MEIDVAVVVRLAVGLVLACSALGKMRNPAAFLQGVVEYRVLPRSLAYVFGLLVMPFEAFAAVSHLTGWLLLVVAPLSVVMFSALGVAVGVQLVRGRDVPCFCFDVSGEERISRRTLGRVALLLIAEALLIARMCSQAVDVEPLGLAAVPALSYAIAWACVVLSIARWVISAADLTALFRLRSKEEVRFE